MFQKKYFLYTSFSIIILMSILAKTNNFCHSENREIMSWDLPSASITIPEGADYSIKIRGFVKNELIFTDYDKSIIDVTYDAKKKTIVIKGLSTGWTRITILDKSQKKVLGVSVKRGAGLLPDNVNVSVTGDTAVPELIIKAINANIELNSIKEQGAYLSIDPISYKKIKEITPGSQATYIIKAALRGSEFIPVSKNIPVYISNTVLKKEEARVLLLSNNPERISKDGILLSAIVDMGKPARMLYHHANSPSGENRKFVVKLQNKGANSSRVHIIDSIVGPSRDEIYSGHSTALGFWERWQHFQGWIVNIPAGSEYILDSVQLKPGNIVSGLSYINPIEGSPVNVIIEALGGGSEDGVSHEIASRAKGIFLNPEILIEKSHSVGKGYTFIYFGGKPYLREKASGAENVGNYGVLYNMNILIDNPFDEENEVQIVFTPGGGPARGIFLINEKLLETPMATHLQEVQLYKETLKPFENKLVKISSFPQSGSNYPVRIVVKSRLVK